MFVASVTILYVSSRYTQFFYHQLPGILGIAGLAQLFFALFATLSTCTVERAEEIDVKDHPLYVYTCTFVLIYIPNHIVTFYNSIFILVC